LALKPNWLHFLHEELCRWLRDCVESVERSGQMTPQGAEKFHQDFAFIIGWLPLRPG
jgi:hypothetical protein